MSLVERLHRLLLDVIKDEFERLGVLEINAVQALLLFNIADNEVTAGELRSRGYYQGSNVSYNLKKLVDMGFMHHQRCEIDRRSVRVRLTERGREVHRVVADLFQRHADAEGRPESRRRPDRGVQCLAWADRTVLERPDPVHLLKRDLKKNEGFHPSRSPRVFSTGRRAGRQSSPRAEGGRSDRSGGGVAWPLTQA